jgi:hypothetical protein
LLSVGRLKSGLPDRAGVLNERRVVSGLNLRCLVCIHQWSYAVMPKPGVVSRPVDAAVRAAFIRPSRWPGMQRIDDITAIRDLFTRRGRPK